MSSLRKKVLARVWEKLKNKTLQSSLELDNLPINSKLLDKHHKAEINELQIFDKESSLNLEAPVMDRSPHSGLALNET